MKKKTTTHFKDCRPLFITFAVVTSLFCALIVIGRQSDKPWTPFKSTPYMPDTVNKNPKR